MTNWNEYEKLLANREKETLEILTEATKHYRQAKANHEAAIRERQSFASDIEALLGRMEHGIYTKQKDDGTRDTL